MNTEYWKLSMDMAYPWEGVSLSTQGGRKERKKDEVIASDDLKVNCGFKSRNKLIPMILHKMKVRVEDDGDNAYLLAWSQKYWKLSMDMAYPWEGVSLSTQGGRKERKKDEVIASDDLKVNCGFKSRNKLIPMILHKMKVRVEDDGDNAYLLAWSQSAHGTMVLGLLVQYGLSKIWIQRIEGLEWIRHIHFHGYGVSMSAVSGQSCFSHKNQIVRR
nr:hypothetical protein [Tanacetum cinerariifolium]